MQNKRFAHALILGAACLVSVGGTQPAQAADFSQGSASSGASGTSGGWTVSLTPYVWATFLSGSSTVRGRTVDVDVNPIQVIGHLERVPFFGYGEMRKGPFALYADFMYADLGLSDGIHTHTPSTVGASLGMNFQQFIAEAGGMYELARLDSGGNLKDPQAVKSFIAIDALAGFRYWNQQADLGLNLAGTVDTGGLVVSGNKAIAHSGTVDWTDPLIGLRLRHQFEPGKELTLRGDFGGFGVGSQFSWNLLAAYNYSVSKTASLYIGYRALDVDYKQGQGKTLYEFDIIQHGPVTGLTVKF